MASTSTSDYRLSPALGARLMGSLLVGLAVLLFVVTALVALFDLTPGAVGSSFIIHLNEDDQVTDATNGNSGARIACAVIEAG